MNECWCRSEQCISCTWQEPLLPAQGAAARWWCSPTHSAERGCLHSQRPGLKKEMKSEKPHRRVKVEWKQHWIILSVTFLHFLRSSKCALLIWEFKRTCSCTLLWYSSHFSTPTFKKDSVCYLYSLPAHVPCVLQCVEASHTVSLTDDD